MFCRPIRGYEVRVRIAPATIACEYIGAAFFYRTILAVPMHVTLAPRSYRAPRGLVRLGGLQKEDHRSKNNDGSHNHTQHLQPHWGLVLLR